MTENLMMMLGQNNGRPRFRSAFRAASGASEMFAPTSLPGFTVGTMALRDRDVR